MRLEAVLLSPHASRRVKQFGVGKGAELPPPKWCFYYGVYAVLVVTPKKTCGFGATPGFGGDIPLFSVLVVTFFSALMVVTKNHPHVVVTSTNRATFGGDKALSAQAALSQRR